MNSAYLDAISRGACRPLRITSLHARRSVAVAAEDKKLAGKRATTFIDESKPTSLRSLKEILSYKIINRSGDSSQLHDVFANDESWSAQYATTNNFHDARRLQETISMSRIKAVDWAIRCCGWTPGPHHTRSLCHSLSELGVCR